VKDSGGTPPIRLDLQIRQGDRIVPAPAEDQAVAARYPGFPAKGEPVNGYRITILTKKPAYAVGEPVRVVHVCESLTPDGALYVMGPKPVLGEYVDDELATEPAPPDGDPLVPQSYDGRVLQGPGLDFNYEITEYRFATAGQHTVQWRLSPYLSNVLSLEVQ
jgi:hypothetical protein